MNTPLISATSGRHGIWQVDDKLKVISGCCGAYLDVAVACWSCQTRCIPADKDRSWGEHINVIAPNKNLVRWVAAWTGLDVHIEVKT